MTNEELNVEIAEFRGWKREFNGDHEDPEWYWIPPNNPDGNGTPPDYCNDLNLMHETENSMSTRLNEKYEYWLRTVCHFPDRESATGKNHHFYRATAKQRVEAFVRTIDKWKE